MKTAVIYYSYDGSCARTAEAIKTALNADFRSAADVFEIKTVDTKRRKGFFKMVWGGSQVMRNKKPALQPMSVDLKAYELIVLGTPVWAASPTPAMVSFLSTTEITGKKIALFCCHAGKKGDALGKLKALLSANAAGNTIVGEADFKSPGREGRAALKEKVEAWVKTFTM